MTLLQYEAEQGYPIRDVGPDWPLGEFLMLNGHYDESYDKRVYAVGGFLATRMSWSTLFEPAWASLLRRNDLDFFHMTDYETRRGPYKDWDNEKRLFEIKEALTIIERTVRFGVGVAIEQSVFDVIGPRLGVRHPYHLCAHWCLLKVAIWRRDNDPTDARIASFFECGAQGAGDLKAGIDELLSVHSAAVSGPLTFAKKTELLPLQAGDIMAYEVFKQTLRNTGHDDRPRRQSLISLEDAGIEYLTEILTLEMMTDLIDQYEALRAESDK